MELKKSNGISIRARENAHLVNGVGYELVKTFDKNQVGCIGRFHREKRFFENSQGIPNIPELFEIDSESSTIRRAFIRGDSLSPYRAELDVPSTVDILLDVSKSLRDMHKRKMIYCDIKPANVILNEARDGVTLIDFDGVEFVDDEKDFIPRVCRGTFPYFAPERLMQQQSFTTYSSDTFGLGMFAYYLLKKSAKPYNSDINPSSLNEGYIERWEKQITSEILNKDARPLKSGCRELDGIVADCLKRAYSKRVQDDELVERLGSLKKSLVKK